MAFRSLFAAALLAVHVPQAASAASLLVDASVPFKAVDHAASGSLYGIAAEGWPPDRFIAAVRPKNFTQMAPGGGQLPNGETKPVGDALVVAPIAARAGASVTIRMPDTFPEFPYMYRGDADWLKRVDAMVRATVAANPPNIYAYEIWNEPDWTWKTGDFDAFWATTFKAIRVIDPDRRILGPSLSIWNEAWMRRFLTAAKASGTLPQIVCWHELDPTVANDLEAHFAAYRALEKELGIGPLPISINEYGAPRDSAVPGALARFIARLERAGADTADLAFWHKPGRLSDLVAPIGGGRGPATDPEPNGAYWLFEWYGEMSGQMVATKPPTESGATLDGFASLDAAAQKLTVVLGGEAGEHQVAISGLTGFGPDLDAQVYVSHWTGTDGGETAPDPVSETRVGSSDGRLTIPISAATARDAFRIVVTPASKAAPFTRPAPRFSMRLEGESAAMVGARVFKMRMAPGNLFAPTVSGDAYAGLLDRKEVSLTFTANVPTAGRYELSFGYSNGLANAAEYMLNVNGTAPQPVTFTPTQFRELIDQVKLDVDLPAGASTIVLDKGPNSPQGYVPQSVIEIDYLDLTALN